MAKFKTPEQRLSDSAATTLPEVMAVLARIYAADTADENRLRFACDRLEELATEIANWESWRIMRRMDP